MSLQILKHLPISTSPFRHFKGVNACVYTLKRHFQPTQGLYIKQGDKIPSVELKEDSPGNRINIADEINGKKTAVIVGVPAAFSMFVIFLLLRPSSRHTNNLFVLESFCIQWIESSLLIYFVLSL